TRRVCARPPIPRLGNQWRSHPRSNREVSRFVTIGRRDAPCQASARMIRFHAAAFSDPCPKRPLTATRLANARSAAGQCGSWSASLSPRFRAIRHPQRAHTGNGCVPIATTLRNSKKETRTGDPDLARADGQQDFFAKGILELLEGQRGFALVAQHF